MTLTWWQPYVTKEPGYNLFRIFFNFFTRDISTTSQLTTTHSKEWSCRCMRPLTLQWGYDHDYGGILALCIAEIIICHLRRRSGSRRSPPGTRSFESLHFDNNLNDNSNTINDNCAIKKKMISDSLCLWCSFVSFNVLLFILETRHRGPKTS